MRKRSIALSLFGYSLAWLVLALAVTAFLLTDLYSRALDTSLRETLEFHLETLVGISLTSDVGAQPASNLADPRFSRPGSGWYWEIRDSSGEAINFSPSLIGTVLPLLTVPFDVDNIRTETHEDGFGTQIRMIERRITLEDSNLLITVTGNLNEMFELVDSFRGQTLIVLSAVGMMLAAMSAIVARFAMRPIGKLSRAVEAVREGDAERVEGEFPTEIAPLADEVNELLRSNTQIIERARSQVGNLAHGLKTPLAVLRNESADNRTKLSKVVLTETEKMSGMVSTYLDRARLAARTAIVGRKSNAGEALVRLTRVMSKLHPDRSVSFQCADTWSIWFRGEESDLEEIAGNLIDNACKWAKFEVRVTLSANPPEGGGRLTILVEDDGAGLTPEEAEKVLRRGVRLDEKTPGSGLGLDIVKELVDIYGGTLNLFRSEMGGLKAELSLPAARSLAT